MVLSLFDFNRNYFQLFDLDTSFEIDVELLTQRYRHIQHQIHPDRFAGKDDQNQRLAVQFTAYINEAFQCLKQPLERAKYLLKLKGLDINLDTQSHLDGEFLLAQMVLREELEAINRQNSPEQAIQRLQAQVNNKVGELSAAFVAAYQSDDDKAAVDAVVKWQFLVKLQRDIATLEDELL